MNSSFDGANQFLPAPNSSLEMLIANFKRQGLDIDDLVALSGNYIINHTDILKKVSKQCKDRFGVA